MRGRVSVLASMLGTALLAVPLLSGACQRIENHDIYSDGAVLRHELRPDQPLTGWKSLIRFNNSYAGCRHARPVEIRFDPVFTGLRFARHISIDGEAHPAYEWSASSPLIVFRLYSHAFGVASTWTPVSAERSVTLEGTTGGTSIGDGNGVTLKVNHALYSRGGPMSPVVADLGGHSRLANYPAAGILQHSLHIEYSFLPLSCTLRDASVLLADVAPSQLARIGATAGNRAIGVQMSCPAAGIPVRLTLTDANGTSGSPGVLAHSPDSTARGVSVQLLRDGKPVQFGQAWDHGTSRQGEQLIAFSAQYLRAGQDLVPGKVGGQALLIAEYQ